MIIGQLGIEKGQNAEEKQVQHPERDMGENLLLFTSVLKEKHDLSNILMVKITRKYNSRYKKSTEIYQPPFFICQPAKGSISLV
jgi:hypothetical protein